MPVTPADCRTALDALDRLENDFYLTGGRIIQDREKDVTTIRAALQPCAGVTEVSVEELLEKLYGHDKEEWPEHSAIDSRFDFEWIAGKYPNGLKIKGEK